MCFVVYDHVGIFERVCLFSFMLCVYIKHTDAHSYLDEVITAPGMNLHHNTDQGSVICVCVCLGFDPWVWLLCFVHFHEAGA